MSNCEQVLDQVRSTEFLKECIDTIFLASQGEHITYDTLQMYIDQHDIIYDGNAIKFLTEHDPSLKESIAITIEFGFDMNSLSSETLATLLFRNLAMGELNKIDFEPGD